MSEVKRYGICGFEGGVIELKDGHLVHVDDFDRVTAERDAERRRADVAVSDANDAEASGKKVSELLANRTAERDAALGRINELLEDFQEMSDQADRRGAQASEFEDRMGDLQAQNGKLQHRLTAADERVSVLEELLQMFIDNSDDKDVVELCEHALKPAEGSGDE